MTDDLLTCWIGRAIFMKQTKSVPVCSDKFGKMAAVDAGSGITRWMPGFVGGRNNVPQ